MTILKLILKISLDTFLMTPLKLLLTVASYWAASGLGTMTAYMLTARATS